MTTVSAFVDRYGYPLSTSSAAAADAYNDGIERVLAGAVGLEEALDAAIEADEGFALAHIAQARNHQYRGRIPEARTAAARARSLAAGTTPREQRHVAAIATAIEGDNPGAVALIREQMAEYPRDAYLLSQVTGPFSLIGFGGGPDWRRESFALLQPLAPAYGDDWWFLSVNAFVHNELEHFEDARRMAERSLALYARSGHTAHTLAHVYFETGEAEPGAAFLAGWLPGYEREAQLYGHLTWHHCLFLLASGHYRAALDRYDGHLRPSRSLGAALITLSDAAALLWRCRLYGATEGPLPWEEVRAYAARMFPHAGVTFGDIHCALAFAAAGDDAALTRLIDELRERLAAGRLPAGAVVPALVQGIAAHAAGDYQAVIRHIEPWTAEIVRIGGSNAQREVLEDTLLDAYINAGQLDRAETLLRSRLARRPSPRDLFNLGRTQAAGGQSEAAASLSRARATWTAADPDAPEQVRLRQTLAAIGG